MDDLRVHAAGEPGPRHGGEHVLYWMQSTFRARDNHALDFAIEQANRLRLPLVVYHGLRHDYPWASDRFHTFLLESVSDLYGEFDELGIQYAFYLERGGDDAVSRRAAGKPSPLVDLARRAALPGDRPPQVRGGAKRSQCGRHQRALALPAFRQPLAGGNCPAREGGGADRPVRQVPGRGPHLAGARVQLHALQPAAPDRRGHSGVGAAGAQHRRVGRSPGAVSCLRAGAGADGGSALERRPDGVRAGRMDAEPASDAVGEVGDSMDAERRGGARDSRASQQQVCA
jgi:hypothetical protein